MAEVFRMSNKVTVGELVKELGKFPDNALLFCLSDGISEGIQTIHRLEASVIPDKNDHPVVEVLLITAPPKETY